MKFTQIILYPPQKYLTNPSLITLITFITLFAYLQISNQTSNRIIKSLRLMRFGLFKCFQMSIPFACSFYWPLFTLITLITFITLILYPTIRTRSSLHPQDLYQKYDLLCIQEYLYLPS